METLKMLLLGVIQGLTEFLPVSSSGHLVLAKTFLGVKEGGMIVEVMLHVATGIAVLVVFRRDIINLIRGCLSADKSVRKSNLAYVGWIILATLPAAFVGLFFDDQVEGLFDTSGGNRAAYLVSFMLLVTAGLLFFSSKKREAVTGNGGLINSGINIGGLTVVKAVLIGVIQAVAIAPGISRSGSTIAMALMLSVSREEAGRFSFIIALPVIFGEAFLKTLHLLRDDSIQSVLTPSLAVGFVASFVVGIVALKFLLTFIKKGKLYYFGYYCVAAAVVSLAVLTFVK